MSRPPEMELRQKAHQHILKKDKQYKRFESIHMNERTGLVTIRWIDRNGDVMTTEKMYGSL